MARLESNPLSGVWQALRSSSRWWRAPRPNPPRSPSPRIGIETLEAREVPATLSGNVFQMLNVDGLFPQPNATFLAHVPGVTVSLDGGTPVSAANGTYSFPGVGPGTHTVAVQAPPGFVGFSAQSLNAKLVVGTSDFTNLNFALTPKNSALVQNLYELVLSRPADLAGFNRQLAVLNPSASNAGQAFQNSGA